MGASVWALRNGDLRRNWTRIAVGHLAGLSPPEFAVAAVRQEWKRKRVRERAQVLGRGCVHGRGHGPYGERHGDDRGHREHVSVDGHVHARDYDCDHGHDRGESARYATPENANGCVRGPNAKQLHHHENDHANANGPEC